MADSSYKFSYQIDAANKKGFMKFDGFFSNEEYSAFLEGYGKIKSTCLGGTICIDATDMLPFPTESLDAAGKIYSEYAQLFSKILVILPKNIVAKGQMKRMFKEQNILDKVEFVTHF